MRLSPTQLQEYRDALRERVCSLCHESGFGGVCRVGESGLCPIDLHLGKLVEAVLSTPRSGRIADYVPRVRELVCARCENQTESGECAARDLAHCGLDSLLLLVVETIEDVHDRRALRSRSKSLERRARRGKAARRSHARSVAGS